MYTFHHQERVYKMYKRLDWESLKFILRFRCLLPEQQALVLWMIRNIDALDRLISVKTISPEELSGIADSAHRKNDHLLALLAEYARFKKLREAAPNRKDV